MQLYVIEGEVIPTNTDATTDDKEKGDKEKDEKDGSDDDDDSTFYRLRGIVVHSGQASGGHYYSFISYR